MAKITKCNFCRTGTGYAAPRRASIPKELRKLTAPALEALRLLHISIGPYERGLHGLSLIHI
eukprot:960078-Prorocentrum_lima.AAC.1